MLLKITEKIIRENAFEQKKRGLSANRPSNNWAQERSAHIRTYVRAYHWNDQICKKNFFSFPENIFIIKSGGSINLSHYVGVFARLKGTRLALCLCNLL